MENTLILLEVLGVCVEKAWSCTNAWLLDSGRFRTRKQHRISIFWGSLNPIHPTVSFKTHRFKRSALNEVHKRVAQVKCVAPNFSLHGIFLLICFYFQLEKQDLSQGRHTVAGLEICKTPTRQQVGEINLLEGFYRKFIADPRKWKLLAAMESKLLLERPEKKSRRRKWSRKLRRAQRKRRKPSLVSESIQIICGHPRILGILKLAFSKPQFYSHSGQKQWRKNVC